MITKPVMTLVLCASLAGTVDAAPVAPAKKDPVTVGAFTVKVAAALGFEATDQKAAREALRSLGVNFAADLNAPLTEGEAARILSDLGANVVAPANSGIPVSASKAGVLAGIIGMQSTSDSLGATQDLPTQCLSSVNRGHCVDCCKDATGLGGRFCGRFCHANIPPPPSDEEPMP